MDKDPFASLLSTANGMSHTSKLPNNSNTGGFQGLGSSAQNIPRGTNTVGSTMLSNVGSKSPSSNYMSRSGSPSVGSMSKPMQASKADDVFGNLVSFGSKSNTTSMSLNDQRRLADLQSQSQSQIKPSLPSTSTFIAPIPSTWQGVGGSSPKPMPSAAPIPLLNPARSSEPVKSSNPLAVLQDSKPTSSFPPTTTRTVLSDPFADIFGTPSSSNNHSRAPSNSLQSTLQQPKPVTSASAGSAAWDLDFLDGGVSKGKATGVSAPSVPQPATITVPSDDPFDLGFLDMQKSKAQAPPVAATSLLQKASTDNEFDIFSNFGSQPPAPVQKVEDTPVIDESESESEEEETTDYELAQIMEMGFDSSSAKSALALCNYNVSDAIDYLIRTEGGKERSSSDDESVTSTSGRQRIDYMSPSGSGATEGTRPTVKQLFSEDTTAPVLNAATSIGLSVLSNAKNVFAFSKKKLNEAYEKASETIGALAEGAEAARAAALSPANPNRISEDEPYRYAKYADDTEGEGSWERPSTDRPQSQDTNVIPAQSRTSGEPKKLEKREKPAVNLLDMQKEDAPPVPKESSKPVRLASPQQISESDQIKERGNELFKIGQFGDAEATYTTAINILPAGDSGLITLYNNRAAARLKIGDYNGVISDCNQAQEIDSTDMKSLLRKASALEALEKWEDAKVHYEQLMLISPSLKGVSEGLERTRKAIRLRENPKPAPVKISSNGDLFSSSAKSTTMSAPKVEK
jgi:tetratricopeptide (TPR) repeat protein